MKPRQHKNHDANCSQIADKDPPGEQAPSALTPVLKRDIGKRASYAS